MRVLPICKTILLIRKRHFFSNKKKSKKIMQKKTLCAILNNRKSPKDMLKGGTALMRVICLIRKPCDAHKCFN